MNYAKAIYHRIVPARIRNPIGLFRRDLMDRVQRSLTSIPLPPRELLANIQMTPWAREYLGVGRRSAESIAGQLKFARIPDSADIALLDFGCGSGRILRYFRHKAWELHGCDIDGDAIAWSRRALSFARLAVSPESPPLPYGDASFDVVISVSVFTHFSPDEQRRWAEDLARVTRPGGLLILSTMGPSVLPNFPHYATPADAERLDEDGSLFFRRTGAFNNSAAFHSVGGLVDLFGSRFSLLRWLERGLDGFQDLSVFRRIP